VVALGLRAADVQYRKIFILSFPIICPLVLLFSRGQVEKNAGMGQTKYMCYYIRSTDRIYSFTMGRGKERVSLLEGSDGSTHDSF
jgi:hypothetical protein